MADDSPKNKPPRIDPGLNLDEELMAMSRRRPRPAPTRLPRAASPSRPLPVRLPRPSPRPPASPRPAWPAPAPLPTDLSNLPAESLTEPTAATTATAATPTLTTAPQVMAVGGPLADSPETSPEETSTWWPDQDDRLAAVRRLVPHSDPDPVSPPPPLPKLGSALPDPQPEPRRHGQQGRVTAGRTPRDAVPRREFRPVEASSLEAAGLDGGLVEALVVKHLYNKPGTSGRALAHDIGLRPSIITRLLEDLKMRRLAVHRSAAAMGDFYYELTEDGRAVARDLQRDSRYAGPAPVPLDQYVVSVKAQAISTEHPRRAQLMGAFADLLISEELVSAIGPAVTHGKGMFMFGPPGNGKTSLAERITRAYGSTIFIPHAIYAGGQIIQVFDPAVHETVQSEDDSDDGLAANPMMSQARPDRRWLRCRRPTVVVGGELTLESLDISYDELDGVCEAPIQVKANGGTLVIDDFGRQRCRPDELLNRWIVPLEKQVDYIALPGGRKEAFPFECLLIFSTNMEPRDLVDEAFLRRIPYKIEVTGPSEAHFRKLVMLQCNELDLDVAEGAIDYLLSEHFEKAGRATRYCHPRDLMLQIYNLCRFREEPGLVTPASIDKAVALYFSLL